MVPRIMAAGEAGRQLKSLSLTPAEVRLALAVADGISLKAFSEKNGVSLHTVRNQLKHVFKKLGVSRQLDLALFVHKLKDQPGDAKPLPNT